MTNDEQNEAVRPQSRLPREEGVSTAAHVSVMPSEVLRELDLKTARLVLDASAGAGGHSEAILKNSSARLIALDADPQAAAAVKERLSAYGARATVREANFADVVDVLRDEKIESIDRALFDLGWNRGQLSSGRGFSHARRDDELSMSYGKKPASGFNAKEILNTWSEAVIADVLFGYGEERYARRIARAVTLARAQKEISTVGDLVDIVAASVPAAYRRGKIHFATKTFQALRIAVNDELGTLRKGIRGAWSILTQGGRIVVISFHSIEDRAVKQLFRELAQEGGFVVTKKPLTPELVEVRANPSARSAKLRVLERL